MRSMMSGVANKFKSGASPTDASYNTLALNGTNQSVLSANSVSLGTQASDFSFSVYAYFTGSQADWSGILLCDSGGSDAPFCGLRIEPNGEVWAIMYNGVSNEFVSGTPTLNVWHNFIMTYTGSSKTIELFIDGSSQGTLVTTATFATMSDAIVGQSYHNRSSQNYMAGSVASAFTFNKVLSSGDIAELQTAKEPESYSTSITDGYMLALPLNDGVFDPYVDRSANGDDGVPTGSPTFTGETLEFNLT